MPVLIRFKQRCQFGYEFHVVGDQLALGEWKILNAVAMEWTDGDVWETVVWVEPNTTMEYKYILKASDNTAQNQQEVVWEGDRRQGNGNFQVEVRPGVWVRDGERDTFSSDVDFMVVEDRFQNETRPDQPSVLECARKAIQRADALHHKGINNITKPSGVGFTPANKGAVDQGTLGAKAPPGMGAQTGMPGSARGRNAVERQASEAGALKQDPKLVGQCDGSPIGVTAGKSEMKSNASTGTAAPHKTKRIDVPKPDDFDEPSRELETLFHTWLVARAVEGEIRELEAYYKAGSQVMDELENVFRSFKYVSLVFGRSVVHATQKAAQRLLKESAQVVLSKLIRCFRKEGSELLSPLDAFKSIYLAQASDPNQAGSSFMDYVRKSELVDESGLEKFLAEFPDLENGLNMLPRLRVKMEFSAVPSFSNGRADYDDVTIDLLQQALDEVCGEHNIDADERKPLKTLLKCLEDLSARLNEGLFV